MGTIQRLPEEVVNRIAAGEVVIRAANAVKELVENALDAGATEIIVTARNGGLDLIKVQDNGKGIAKEDMAIVCERFTTSKLRRFEDLESMSTFGFRGEALASISYVAKVSITSKTADAPYAYVGQYSSGKLVGEIRSSAGLNGTTVTAEELFYNCPSRRRTLKYPADEMNRIADVIVRYAIHNPNVSFTLRRCGSGADFRTAGNGDVPATIYSLLGGKAAKELVPLNFADPLLFFSLKGWMARPIASCTSQTLLARQNHQKVFFVFINGRIVDCPSLKHAMDLVLGAQDKITPFVMLSLEIAPNRVDVNVHPTKSIVYFLEQDAIISSIQDYVETTILNTANGCNVAASIPLASNDAKAGTSSSQLPGPPPKKKCTVFVSEELGGDGPSTSQTETLKRVYAHQLVRTDAKERRLDEFVIRHESQQLSQIEFVDDDGLEAFGDDLKKSDWREFNFTSLKTMKKAICSAGSVALRSLFKEHIYVGAVDPSRVLLQHSTSLYMLKVRECLRHFFYQLLVLSFGNYGSFALAETAPIGELFLLDNPKESEENAARCVEFLVSHREMLNDYFCIRISELGEIEKLPSLIDGYLPQLESLPSLISTLVYDVDWEQEQTCFEGICWALADFFCVKQEYCDGENFSGMEGCTLKWEAVLRDLLFPAIKKNFLPPENLNSSIRRLADLSDLYKVFERC